MLSTGFLFTCSKSLAFGFILFRIPWLHFPGFILIPFFHFNNHIFIYWMLFMVLWCPFLGDPLFILWTEYPLNIPEDAMCFFPVLDCSLYLGALGTFFLLMLVFLFHVVYFPQRGWSLFDSPFLSWVSTAVVSLCLKVKTLNICTDSQKHLYEFFTLQVYCSFVGDVFTVVYTDSNVFNNSLESSHSGGPFLALVNNPRWYTCTSQCSLYSATAGSVGWGVAHLTLGQQFKALFGSTCWRESPCTSIHAAPAILVVFSFW